MVRARRVAEFKRLMRQVRRFRVISCRDAAFVSSKCAGGYSVKSVTSVLKKRLGPLPGPSRVGMERLVRCFFSLADGADGADFWLAR